MPEQQLDKFIENFNTTRENRGNIRFEGSEPAELIITVKGPKVSFMILSHEPVLFFQLLSLNGYRRDGQGKMVTACLPLKECPMSLPAISREMVDWGWDCDGARYLPFYYHKQSGKGLPKKTTMGGYQWATEISDSPGTPFNEAPVELYPEWDFAVLHFRTFITGISGIEDVSRVLTAGKNDLAGMTFQPYHMVEWFAVPPWGAEGLKLWNQILQKLTIAYMGGMVYPVGNFIPDVPLGGSKQLYPVRITPEKQKAIFFDPLSFWQERWR